MKRRLLNLCLIAGMLSFGSCGLSDDIDGLQDQIDDLNEQIVENEQAQQEVLLAQIAELQLLIADLQGENSEMTAEYEQLLQDLLALQQDVEDGQRAIHYGNVLTDADFAAVLESGASIITGKVSITNQSQIESIASVSMIGGYLELKGLDNVSIPNLENVSGSVMVSALDAVDATVSFGKLVSVGGDFEIHDNSQMVSFVADELVMVYGTLRLEENSALASFSCANLDLVGDLFINEGDDWFEVPGILADLDLGQTDVVRDVFVYGIGYGSTLSLGVIGNEFKCLGSDVLAIEFQNEILNGSFIMEKNQYLEDVVLDNLTGIEGSLIFKTNGVNSGAGFGSKSVKASSNLLQAFDDLEYVGLNVTVTGNDFAELTAFNSVTSMGKNVESPYKPIIEFSYNGELTKIEVFNNLFIDYDPEAGSDYQLDVTIKENTQWLNSFNRVERLRKIKIAIKTSSDEDGNVIDGVLLAGFDVLNSAFSLEISAQEITDVTAFPLLAKLASTSAGYFTMNFRPTTVASYCSMDLLWDHILMRQEYAFSKSYFNDVNTWGQYDRTEAMPMITDGCYSAGI